MKETVVCNSQRSPAIYWWICCKISECRLKNVGAYETMCEHLQQSEGCFWDREEKQHTIPGTISFLPVDFLMVCPLGLAELSQGREGRGWQWLLRDGLGPCPSKEPLPKELHCPQALHTAFWALLGGTACAQGQQGACRDQLWGKLRTSWPCPPCCQLSSGAQPGLTLPIAPTDAASTTARVPHSQKSTGSGLCQGTLCLLELMALC